MDDKQHEMSKRKAPPSNHSGRKNPKKLQVSPFSLLIQALQTSREQQQVIVPEKEQQPWRINDGKDPWSYQHLLKHLSYVEKNSFAFYVGGDFIRSFMLEHVMQISKITSQLIKLSK